MVWPGDASSKPRPPGPAGSHRGGARFRYKGHRPGPGSHDLPSFPDASPVVPSAASFSMASRREERSPKKCEAGAGPGSYYPRFEIATTKQRCYGFGRAKRVLSDVQRNVPSTQSAQSDNYSFKSAPGCSFGTEAKFFQAPGVSAKPQKGQKMPGPGEHNPSDHFTAKSDPSWKMSKPPHPAADTPRKTVSEVPGPGAYKPEDSFKAKSKERAAPSFGFGTTARLTGVHSKAKSPGPGQYSTSNATRTGHSCTGSAPKWSMGARPEYEPAEV